MNFKRGIDHGHHACLLRQVDYIEDYMTNGYNAKLTSERFDCSYQSVLDAVTRYFKREANDMVLRSKIWDEIEIEL